MELLQRIDERQVVHRRRAHGHCTARDEHHRCRHDLVLLLLLLLLILSFLLFILILIALLPRHGGGASTSRSKSMSMNESTNGEHEQDYSGNPSNAARNRPIESEMSLGAF